MTDGLAVPAGRPVRRGLAGSRLARPVGAGWEHTTLVLGGPRVDKSMSYIVSLGSGRPRFNGVVLSREPTGDPEQAARWWAGIFDPFLDRLVALDGPFRSCQGGHLAGTVPARFAAVADWFEDWFAQVLTRRIPADVWWCPSWPQHPEVVVQMTALWACRERTRLMEPAAMVGWWDTAERVLARLCAPAGPFAACKTNRQTHVEEWTTLSGRRILSGP